MFGIWSLADATKETFIVKKYIQTNNGTNGEGSEESINRISKIGKL